jgi:hypothetical protein
MKINIYSFFVAACAIMMGCRGNLAPFQPARTMPAKGFALGVEGSAIGAASNEGDELEGTFSIAGRYALTDRIEIGARIGTTRPEIMAKFRLDNGKPGSVAFSLAPSIGAFAATATGIRAFNDYGQLPLLIGIPLGKHELVLSPSVHFGHAVNVDTYVWGFAAGPGASIGFVAQPKPWLAILPSFALAVPFFHAGPLGIDSNDTVAYQLGIAVMMGKLQ